MQLVPTHPFQRFGWQSTAPSRASVANNINRSTATAASGLETVTVGIMNSNSRKTSTSGERQRSQQNEHYYSSAMHTVGPHHALGKLDASPSRASVANNINRSTATVASGPGTFVFGILNFLSRKQKNLHRHKRVYSSPAAKGNTQQLKAVHMPAAEPASASRASAANSVKRSTATVAFGFEILVFGILNSPSLGHIAHQVGRR
jgi:preprotein translocase subunit SecG